MTLRIRFRSTEPPAVRTATASPIRGPASSGRHHGEEPVAVAPVVPQCHVLRTTRERPLRRQPDATVHSHSEESIAETLSVRIGGIELRLAADAPLRARSLSR